MSKLVLGTNVVSFDEPCFSLKEIIAPAPDSKSLRRYQVLKVIRHGDKLAEMRRDLGPARGFQATEFVIPGGVADPQTGRVEILHTVGELVDIADLIRSDVYERPEPPKGADLIQGYYDSPDKKRRRRKRQSTFGYGGKTQRS
jgi:hypothetical protein